MSYYSLYCFDLMGSVVFRDNFEADNNAEAKAIAGAICDACADEHHSHELWKGDLPIESGETFDPEIQAHELSMAARKTAQDRMIALRNSSWLVSRSPRLAERIAAWALGPDTDPTVPSDRRMRQFRRGIEFSVHSSDGVHWTWLADLKTNEGERMQGTVNGTKAVALRLCIAAIDETLSEKVAGPPQPSARSAIQPLEHPMRLADTPPTGRQVLVAEDEAMFRDAAVESLKACGFEVFQASDGEEALAILKEHPHISLLISDVRMPFMDGYALVEASLRLNPNLKVIMMSGYANVPSKLVLDRRIDTLHKPFDLSVLSSRAEDLAAVH
ncbi:MAG TPA: response regulator [Rhizomicrobium sp.]|nr:response regulator [Rhizomicrobium sp.]